ncbi:MAG TPA: 4-(cytidine 5'-diphospho)-2-C-methyl-D-erythritol kinase [Actinomycetes bacterium]|nr:4-(cytidine 5'-diphospho)-2-C-methyl-D-erythritol kinase [Actinomycetes bacterium]
MSPVTVRVPAKVNLELVVGAQRDDGFHDLATVYQAVSLFDDVTALPGDHLTVSVEGEGADSVPNDDDNLALVAARTLAEHLGVEPKAHLHIHKAIPVAAGLAGGSADAAGALVALDRLWEAHLDRDELVELAASVGSDVPFALVGHTAMGLGRGDELTPVLARGHFHWVFAFADGGLATPDVYRELDRLRGGSVLPEPRVSDAVMTALRAGNAVTLGGVLANDLQRAAVALRPNLTMTLDVGDEYGALGGLVSGSGPTCAFLARDEEHALDLAVALTSSGTCRSVASAVGPVPGARVVDA